MRTARQETWASRSTAGSGSPGTTRFIFTISGQRHRRSCSETRSFIASALPDWLWTAQSVDNFDPSSGMHKLPLLHINGQYVGATGPDSLIRTVGDLGHQARVKAGEPLQGLNQPLTSKVPSCKLQPLCEDHCSGVSRNLSSKMLAGQVVFSRQGEKARHPVGRSVCRQRWIRQEDFAPEACRQV